MALQQQNGESLLRTGKQRLKRLRAWRSGTYSRKLLEVVKCRLIAMKKMTRFRNKSNWQGGSGNGTADLKCTLIFVYRVGLLSGLSNEITETVCETDGKKLISVG